MEIHIANYVLTIAGSTNSNSNDGYGTSASFNFPEGLVFDPIQNQLIICDTDSSLIRSLDLSSKFQTRILKNLSLLLLIYWKYIAFYVKTIAGVLSVIGKTDGAASTATFSYPTDVAINPLTQDIYIADNGNGLIRSLNRTNSTVSTVVNSYLPNYLAFYSDGTLVITGYAVNILYPNGKIEIYFERKNAKRKPESTASQK